MAYGETRIDIAAITPSGISQFGELATPMQTLSTFSVDKNDLGNVNADWSAFFNQDTLVVQHISLQGKLSDMHLDLLAQ